MKYNHTVKYNGVWYKAGENVPNDVEEVSEAETEAEEVAEMQNIDATSPVDDVVNEEVVNLPTEEVDEPTKANLTVTKTDVNRMLIADLKKFAKKNGIKNADAKSGAELKKELINKLGL